MTTRLTIVFGALWGFTACLSASSDRGNQPQVVIDDPAGQGGAVGNALAADAGLVSSTGGVAGAVAGGSSSGGAAGAFSQGFGGQCAAECISEAVLTLDFPASLGAAREGTLKVCRNSECYSVDLAQVPDSTDVSLTQTQAIIAVTIDRASARASLRLAWQPNGVGSPLAIGDRYRVEVDSMTTGSAVEVFDQGVDYTTTYGCTGSCLFANIDTRGSIGSGGEAGAD